MPPSQPPDLPGDLVDRITSGERLRLPQPDGREVAVLSAEDLARLEALEDDADAVEAALALLEMRARGEKPIAWEQVKADLGL